MLEFICSTVTPSNRREEFGIEALHGGVAASAVASPGVALSPKGRFPLRGPAGLPLMRRRVMEKQMMLLLRDFQRSADKPVC
ncbi:hypothetical protein EYF80_035819 [Liparis tanakae]|uniref:Uncharacterized protein n=1 Tax=Liparis tanakae TaxID=230148 RepID=A0A4Z2GL67_9TELE|nr:hypothetical protein EYF80_035819 [Liparis tanakae]